MFNDERDRLGGSKSRFAENVNDSFGRSVVRDVYEPIEAELKRMDISWEEAEAKRIAVSAMLTELRLIL